MTNALLRTMKSEREWRRGRLLACDLRRWLELQASAESFADFNLAKTCKLLADDGTPCRYSGLLASQLKKALLAISDARTAQLLKASRVQIRVLRGFESRGYIH